MSEWDSGPAAYLRVANDLRAKIEKGEIPPGAPIPSVNELMRTYGIANATVQKALRPLKAAGLVETRPGVGVFVREVRRKISRSADHVSPVVPGAPASYNAVTDLIEVTEVAPPDEIAELLGLDPGEPAVRRTRHMREGDEILEIAVSHLPIEIAGGTKLGRHVKLAGGVPTALRSLGYPPRRSREWVDARMPTSYEIETLRLQTGVPVFRLLRMTWTDDDRPVEALEMVFGGNRYRLEYDLPVHD